MTLNHEPSDSLLKARLCHFSLLVAFLATMHADILFEALRFSSRPTFDAVQLVSRALRDTIGDSATLPLRFIGRARLVCFGLSVPSSSLVRVFNLAKRMSWTK